MKATATQNPRFAESSTASGQTTAMGSSPPRRPVHPGEILLRGYPVKQLIGQLSFTDQVWPMLRGGLPTAAQSRLLEAALVAAVDHGPQALSIAAAPMAATCGLGLTSAVATRVNPLGDTHGGSGQQSMEVLASLPDSERAGTELPLAAPELADRDRTGHRPVSGSGHRFHPRDPRRAAVPPPLS
ncbi:citrate/2-methylcitrate synthase [Streptomyces sp. MMG1121]|uniref:citrate/2-methylcitrate synthase n=1 Tax=Streptomyces sp. MMG1121 TaxID=1415544 RepID=UPI0006B00EB7|nr:citrate/2-methylcitrate synthase [Streptomyces sp. MMG1121]